MITNKQKWLLGGLIALSTAVWTPQVMERLGGDTSAQLSVASGPGEQEMLLAEMESGDLPPAARPSAALSQEPLSAETPGASRTSSLESGVGSVLRSPGDSDAIVSEVLRTLRQSEAFHVNSDLPELEVDPPAETEESEQELPSLLVFVQDHPLRGTIVGETTRMALIGTHRVNVGEIVPGTAATLTGVDRGRATLTEGDMVIDLVLDPLETSADLMRARSRAQGSSGNDDTGAAGPLDQINGAGVESVPGSATHNQGTTPPELPGSTGDF